MKMLKRSLALLLSLLLLLGFGAPAMAEENAPDFEWSYLQQPPQRIYIASREAFTIDARKLLPEGVNVSYQWYYWSADNNRTWRAIAGATGPVLTVGANDAHRPPLEFLSSCPHARYRYVATFEITNADGEVINTFTHEGVVVGVTRERTVLEWISSFFVALLAAPMIALQAMLMGVFMSFGIGLPFAPIFFIIGLAIPFIPLFSGC